MTLLAIHTFDGKLNFVQADPVMWCLFVVESDGSKIVQGKQILCQYINPPILTVE